MKRQTETALTPLTGALQVASFGIRVFPVWNAPEGICGCPDGKRCSSPGKHPIQRAWQMNATTNEAQINAWHKRYGQCNWGLRTDDLPTADVDPRAGGTLEAAEAILPTTTWRVATGGGGWHLGYLPPQGQPVPKGGNNLLGPGLDVKAKGGFVVAVGSIHMTGVPYTWATPDGGPPDFDTITAWPPVAPPAPGPTTPSANGQPPGDMRGGAGARSTLSALLASPPSLEGEGRNNWLTSIAGHVFRNFPHEDGAIELIKTLNQSLEQPLEDSEVSKVIGSIGHTDSDARDARFEDAVAKRAWTMKVSQEAARVVRQVTWREPPGTLEGRSYLAQPDEEDPWAIVDLLTAGGNALLAAQYKVGKTTLLLNLMRSMCDNKPFLGRFPVQLDEDARVGFFNYEMSPIQFRRWVRRLGVQNPERFAIADLRGFDVRVGTPDGDEWIINWLKHWDVQAWIVDPYAKAYSGESENDNTEVARFTDAVDAIKERAGVDIAVLGAHFGRQEFESGTEHVRGATRLDDWADARWIQTKDADGDRYFSAIGRDVEVEESRITFNRDTLGITLMEGGRAERAYVKVEGAVLTYIRESLAQFGHDPEALKRAVSGRGIEAAKLGRALNVRGALRSLEKTGSLRAIPGPANTVWHVTPEWEWEE